MRFFSHIVLLLPVCFSFTHPTPTHTLAWKKYKKSSLFSVAPSTSTSTSAIVVGSGVGGLTSSLVLTSLYGRSVRLLESHPTSLGGCAHSFILTNKSGQKFTFDAGPSLLTGLSQSSYNPLRQAFDLCGLKMPEMVEYDGWIIHSKGTKEDMGVGEDVDVDIDIDGSDGNEKFWISYKMSTSSFPSIISSTFGAHASTLFKSFTASLLSPGGLYESSNAIPPFALRGDKYTAWSLKSYALQLLGIGPGTGKILTGPFRAAYDQFISENPPVSPSSERFLRNHFDYLSFALSGYDMSRTQAAPVAYMTGDLHLPGANINFPKRGGALGPIIDSMAEKISSHPGSTISTGTTVTSLLLSGSDNRCVGVNAVDPRGNSVTYHATEGVILNVPIWSIPKILENTISLMPDGEEKDKLQNTISETQHLAGQSKRSGSFMHAYLAVPSQPSDFPLECHHSVIMDWGERIDAKQNMVIISIPTVFDKSLAPEGFHVIHAYTAASDDFDQFSDFLVEEEKPKPSSPYSDGTFGNPNPYKSNQYANNPDYVALKDKQSQVLFDAIARVIPDIRERIKHKDSVVEIGTPLTHRRFNRRAFGSYGPGVDEDGSVWSLLQTKALKLPNLYLAGDSIFPGIGIPGVAASGVIAANSFVGVREHTRELKRGRKEKFLQ